MTEFEQAEQSDFDQIAALHKNAALLPFSYLQETVYTIVLITLSITVVHLTTLKTYQICRSHTKGYSHATAWKVTYQFTNLVVNLVLGMLGIYHYTHTIPRQASGTERVSGWEELGIFGAMQIGYQLWALPVGFFFVNETPTMLAHHLQVIIVGALGTFFTNGFRYVTPFFFGVIEISSVPLSIMNHFKANPDLINSYPGLYTFIRVFFMIVFLTVRVIMWLPNMYGFLHDCGILCYTCDNLMCNAGLGVSFLAAVGLTFLQLMWAYIILQGFVKLLTGGKNKKTV